MYLYLTIIYIAHNYFYSVGAKYIANALATNKALTALHMRIHIIILYIDDNHIEPEGTKYIADALVINKTLTRLDLCIISS